MVGIGLPVVLALALLGRLRIQLDSHGLEWQFGYGRSIRLGSDEPERLVSFVAARLPARR